MSAVMKRTFVSGVYVSTDSRREAGGTQGLTGVLEREGQLVGGVHVVQNHRHAADTGDGKDHGDVLLAVSGHDGYSVAMLDAECEKTRSDAVTLLLETLVCPPRSSPGDNHRLLLGVEVDLFIEESSKSKRTKRRRCGPVEEGGNGLEVIESVSET